MSWSTTIYLRFDSQAAFTQALFQQFGIVFNTVSPSSWSDNFAILPVPTPWITPPVYDGSVMPPVLITPGVLDTGYWVMVRLEKNWVKFTNVNTSLATIVRTPANPPTTWFGA